jgi:hypothetical protein
MLIILANGDVCNFTHVERLRIEDEGDNNVDAKTWSLQATTAWNSFTMVEDITGREALWLRDHIINEWLLRGRPDAQFYEDQKAIKLKALLQERRKVDLVANK